MDNKQKGQMQPQRLESVGLEDFCCVSKNVESYYSALKSSQMWGKNCDLVSILGHSTFFETLCKTLRRFLMIFS